MNRSDQDIVWMLSCGGLVFIMQAGFCCGQIQAASGIDMHYLSRLGLADRLPAWRELVISVDPKEGGDGR